MKSLESVVLVLLVFSGAGCRTQQTTEAAAVAPSSDPVTCCREAKALLASLANATVAPSRVVTLSPGRKQLFLDNGVLARLERIERKLHPPKKYGPVIRPDRPWEGGTIQIRGGPSWNPQEKLWMIWYTGGYATSKDGVHWEKPILGLREYKGSRQNNLMLPRTEYIFKDPLTGREILRQIGDGTTIDNPYYDPTEPDPGRRYKGAGYKGPACCLTGGRGMGFYPAVSPDGRKWQILETSFIPSGDESHFFKDETRNLYVATVKHPGPYGRSVYLSVSKDFDHWTDPRDCLIFHTDKLDQQLGAELVRMHLDRPDLRKPVYNRPEEYQTDIYNLPVFTYEGLYIGMPTVFNHSGNAFYNSDGFSMVELAVSRDLLHWDRLGNREKFIPLSPLDGEKNYDTAQLLAANRPIIKDNEFLFYYTGLKWRDHPDDLKTGKLTQHPDAGAICLAKLRLDGFVSLDAGQQEGTVLTKPLVLEGKTLHLNIDAPGGAVSAEVLDAGGKEIFSGFSLRDCVPAGGDKIDAELRWKGTNLASLAGRAVLLRFALHNASLYAFWLD